jgi:Secretion system C-terminal sorting domain
MKHATFAVLFVLLAASSFAQPDTLWTREGNIHVAARVPEGGIIVGGDSALVRLDEEGNELWTQTLSYEVRDIDPGQRGGFIMSGAGNGGHVARMDADGLVEWEFVDEVEHGERFNDVVGLPGGGAIVLRGGWTIVAVQWLDPFGQPSYVRERHGYYDLSMEALSDGCVLISGGDWNVYYDHGNFSLWKIDPRNNTGWYRSWMNPLSYSHGYYAFELSNSMILSFGNHTLNDFVSLHNSRGFVYQWRILDPEMSPPRKAFETADHCVLVVTQDRISKFDLSDIPNNPHWSIEFPLSAPVDAELANDGGLIVCRDRTLLVRYEPEAGVTVESDTQTVPPGTSTIHITATIDNILLDNTELDLWTVLYPSSGDPIVSDISTPVTLVPGETLVHQDSLVLLAEYPPGEYMCRVHVGDYEHDITMGANTFEFVKEGVVTAVGDANDGSLLPDAFALTAYPNPFNASTTISLELPTSADLRLSVYNIAGREVAVLQDGYINAGVYQFSFDAGSLASGIYFVDMVTPERALQHKLVLLR